jgi:hypothetical protein
MEGPAPEFRCEACSTIHAVTALARNKWGDPCCPDCKSPRLARHQTRLSGVLAIYFLFNVF